MLVEDTSAAGDFLLRNNYYRLNIYFHKFMSADNCFQVGTSITIRAYGGKMSEANIP